MDVKKIVLLVGALLIAGVTAIMAKNMFTGASAPEAQATPQQAPRGPEVLVATRTLPVGTIIDAEAFRYQASPDLFGKVVILLFELVQTSQNLLKISAFLRGKQVRKQCQDQRPAFWKHIWIAPFDSEMRVDCKVPKANNRCVSIYSRKR